MRKVIDEAMAIIDNSDFNSLPFEERKRIDIQEVIGKISILKELKIDKENTKAKGEDLLHCRRWLCEQTPECDREA